MRVFVVAMPCEADCLLGHLKEQRERRVFGRRVIEGQWLGESVAVVISGVGKSNAAAATQLALSALSADEILNFGVVGGLRPTMEVGELFAVRAAVEYDFDLSALNGTEVGTLNERTSPYIPLTTRAEDVYPLEVLGTGDRFSDDEADLPLLRRLGIGLRDMEGAAIAHVCETAGIPFRSLKCVSDVHGKKSMTGQYRDNLAFCLTHLAQALSQATAF